MSSKIISVYVELTESSEPMYNLNIEITIHVEDYGYGKQTETMYWLRQEDHLLEEAVIDMISNIRLSEIFQGEESVVVRLLIPSIKESITFP